MIRQPILAGIWSATAPVTIASAEAEVRVRVDTEEKVRQLGFEAPKRIKVQQATLVP